MKFITYKKGSLAIAIALLIVILLAFLFVVLTLSYMGNRQGAMSGSGIITSSSSSQNSNNNNSQTNKNLAKACGVIPVDKTNIITSADARLMPPAAADFNNLAAQYRQATGKKLYVSSMFRSREQQEQLKKDKPDLANAPGTSMHEAGLAFDISISQMSDSDYETFKQLSLENNFAVNRGSGGRKGARESWHFDYTGLKSQGYWYGNVPAAIEAAYNC